MINISNDNKDNNNDLSIGKLVVSLCPAVIPELFVIRELPHATYPEFVKCRPIIDGKPGSYFCWLAVNEIRLATGNEEKISKRLSVDVSEHFTRALDAQGDVP
ncbi:hypothetical protein ABFY41_11110 [Acinetobacter haemolyticus]|uniref:hypothetical protein n=1 Tax=Acinetobacter haemolyticus TaxID=29430 RepID=UPI003D1B5A58